MFRLFSSGLLVGLLLLGASACEESGGSDGGGTQQPTSYPIGTWPRPDLGVELCDGEDNDGDGLIDEGCSCPDPTDSVKSCTAIHDSGCDIGKQNCVNGFWQNICIIDGTPVSAPKVAPSISIDSISPTALEHGVDSTLDVSVQVHAACPSIRLSHITLALRSPSPSSKIFAEARDDGEGIDAQAADGIYSVQLQIPYGQSFSNQTLTLVAAGLLAQQTIDNSVSEHHEDSISIEDSIELEWTGP